MVWPVLKMPPPVPIEEPTENPTEAPSEHPSDAPSNEPTEVPTSKPSRQPTEQPSEQPTFNPTVAPTEICSSLQLTISGANAVTKYNGIYNKQSTLVNNRDWWQARNDLGGRYLDHGVSIFWSDATERWTIEASDVRWEASATHSRSGRSSPAQ